MGIDLLAASGHKSLMGPQGTGFLYIRRGTPVSPVTEKRRYGFRIGKYYPAKDRTRRDGIRNAECTGITGLAEGIRFVKRTGLNQIRKREEKLIEYLSSLIRESRDISENILSYSPGETDKKVGIFSFNIRGMNSERAADLLDRRYGIAVRAGFHCAPFAHRAIGTEDGGCVRISVSMFNTERDMYDISRTIGGCCQNELS